MTEEEREVVLNAIHTDVSHIKTILLGNGNTKDSIVVRLAMLEQSVTNCQSGSLFRRRGQATIIASCISSVAAIAIALIALFK